MKVNHNSDKVGHLAKECRLGQKIKNRSVQEDLDKEDDKQQGLIRGSKQVWYDRSLYVIIPKIDILFHIDKQLVKKERIMTKPIDRSFKIFNVDRTKNREVT